MIRINLVVGSYIFFRLISHIPMITTTARNLSIAL
jgi:hypothetical protein